MSERHSFAFGRRFSPNFFGVNSAIVIVKTSFFSAFASSIIFMITVIIDAGGISWSDLVELPLGILFVSLFALIFIFPCVLFAAFPLGLLLKLLKVSWPTAVLTSSIFAVVFGWLIDSAVFGNGKVTWICVLSALATSTIWLWLLSRTARDIQPADIDGVVVGAP